MQLWPYREQLLSEAVSHMLGVIFFLFVITAGAQHHDRSPSNDHCENHFNPRPESQEPGTDGNENTAENDRANDAPVEDTVTKAVWHFEPGENCHEDEQVVHAQDFFQSVASDEQTRYIRAVLNVEEASECKRYRDPEDRPH